MGRLFALGVVTAAGVLVFAIARYAYSPQEAARIEIAGIRLGMSGADYRTRTRTAPGIEIGGVTGAPQGVFTNDKLASFTWRFTSSRYEVVRGAIKAQYPQLQCTPTKAAGAPDEHEVCSLGGTLFVSQGRDEPQARGWGGVVSLRREGVRGGR